MSAIDKIKKPVSNEMDDFEKYFRNSMKTKVPLINVITNYIIRRKGKQLRPMLVFLSAKLNGEISEGSYTAAALIELLHTATLIHDDVVDESYLRRGFFSINALWKNKIAVLAGDFLLSKGLLLSIENKRTDLLEIVSEAVKEMSEGELLQMDKARKLDITEEVYFEIIQKKTATLIASCSAAGAKSVGASDEKVQIMKEFGLLMGIAFQIKDDIFDFEANSKIGKPTGNDIKEKKMTLPLIYALNNSDHSEKKHIIHLIKRKNNKQDKIDEITLYVKNKGGLDYARKKMMEYKELAINKLSVFPDSEAKNSLIELVEYTTQRTK